MLCTHGGGEGAPWGFFNVLGLGLGKGRGPPTRTMAGWVGELRPSCHRHRHVEPWMAGGDPTALRVQPGPRPPIHQWASKGPAAGQQDSESLGMLSRAQPSCWHQTLPAIAATGTWGDRDPPGLGSGLLTQAQPHHHSGHCLRTHSGPDHT